MDEMDAVSSKYAAKQAECERRYYQQFNEEVLREEQLERERAAAEQNRQREFLNKYNNRPATPVANAPTGPTVSFRTAYYPSIQFEVYERTAKRINGNMSEGILSKDVLIPQHINNGSGVFVAKKGTLIRFYSGTDYSQMTGIIQTCTLRDAACLANTENKTACLPPNSKVNFGIGWVGLYEMGACLNDATLGEGTNLKQWRLASIASGWNEQDIYFNQGTHVKFYVANNAKIIDNVRYEGAVAE
jgi:hypothetical protein